MIHIVTPTTVLGRASLKGSTVPRKLLWRGLAMAPRSGPFSRLFWRVILDQSLPRYLIALLPFPIAAMINHDLALPLTQAPLLMFVVVYLVEVHVLSISSPAKRRKLIERTDAARGLDRFDLRARAVLTRIAAGRRDETERLHLVVEQSALARVPPLTVVSLQKEGRGNTVLELSDHERALIRAGLFDEEEDGEDLLHRINLSQNTYLRSAALDPASVSGHARLQALAAAR